MSDDRRLTVHFHDLTGDSALFKLKTNLHGITLEMGCFYIEDIRDLLESAGEALKRADAWTAEEAAVVAKLADDDRKRRQRAEKAERERLKALDILDEYEKRWATPESQQRDGERNQ